VDKSLSEGVKTAKKKFMDADDGKKKEAPKKSDGELDKVADSLNEAWDNTLKGVGKILKTQETNSKTTTAPWCHIN
jgi:hypothetical protein